MDLNEQECTYIVLNFKKNTKILNLKKNTNILLNNYIIDKLRPTYKSLKLSQYSSNNWSKCIYTCMSGVTVYMIGSSFRYGAWSRLSGF